MRMERCFRRIAGFVQTRFAELKLKELQDFRQPQGRRWQLSQLLTIVLVALMAGCRGLKELEELTTYMSHAMRRLLNMPRRLADTTLRDVLCRMPWTVLRRLLHLVVHTARRRKALCVEGLPFHMVSMDGKATAMPNWEGPYAQRHIPEHGKPFGLLRTVTSTLVTAPGKPCIDVSPIPAQTNEMGHFQTAFGELNETYDQLFTLVSYDAGANSEVNASYVRAQGKHYLFRLNNDCWHMQQLAADLLKLQPPTAERCDVISNHQEVRRRLRLFRVNDTSLPPLPRKTPIWSHARVLLSVESETLVDNRVVATEVRYFASSLLAKELSPEQWLWATVRHWGVETCHQLLDTAFAEDDKPWIRACANGMLAMIILRRIAYTLLSLFRSVTQRSDEAREQPWPSLMRLIHVAMMASTDNTVAGLRWREVNAAFG